MTQLNEWLTIDKTSGTGNAEITLSASSYEELVDRTTSLKIQGVVANSILTVKQNAMIPTITLSNNHFYFDYNGGKYLDTTITSNVDWRVSSSDNWFYVSHDYGSKGETVFRVEVTENEDNKRDGTVTFSYNGEVLATLFITQYGLVSFVNDTMSFGYLAETQQNKVLIDSPWYLIKDGDWFTVTPTNGSNASNITVSVEENDGVRRVGSISLYTTDGDFYLGSITVKQVSEFDSQYLWLETIDTNKYVNTGLTLKYSFDGVNWRNGNSINMNGNKIIYMYSETPTDDLDLTHLDLERELYHISYGGKHSVGGNAAAIGKNIIGLFEDNVNLVDASELDITGVLKGNWAFYGCENLKYPPKSLPSEIRNNCSFGRLFQGCKNLLIAPQLPALELKYSNYNGGDSTYDYMFYDCTSLVEAPELPATTLADGCYGNMFGNCTSLKVPPQLPAMVMKRYCYAGMFDNCTSLETAPQLPATTLADSCYKYMFLDCTSLVEAPSMLPAMVLAEYCYNGMFYNCTSLPIVPQLPATTLAANCYDNMFYKCSSLTSAPDLLAYTVPYSAYARMFYGCGNIKYIKMLGVEIGANGLREWVYGVAGGGTFVKAAENTSIPVNSINGIPYSWTVETATS